MGRYYSNSIEGKWWFGVQCSTTPEKFGAEEVPPTTIEYTIYRENLDVVTNKMEELEKEMGDIKQKLDEFFGESRGYNDQMLVDVGIDPKYLEPYADWIFGNKVIKFFENNPDEDECLIDSET